MALPRIAIGFDTSLRSSGIGVVRAEGNARRALYYAPVRVPARLPMSAALVALDEAVNRVLDEYAPTEAALEGVFYAKNARTAMILCHARGVVAAEKAQVQAMVARILALPPPIQNDAADALAIALAHLNRATSLLPAQTKTL